MKELEEILKKHITDLNSPWLHYEEKEILNAMKEAYNKGVTDSAESVRTDRGKTHNDCGECGYTEIDKQSILKLLIP